MPRSPVARVDLVGILRTLARHGPQALAELFEAVVMLDGDQQRNRDLDEALEQLGAAQT
jgi:hypothetical protein